MQLITQYNNWSEVATEEDKAARGWIRHSSDPLDLSWVSQLDWSEGPAGRTWEEHLPSTPRCHTPLHHLKRQQNMDHQRFSDEKHLFLGVNMKVEAARVPLQIHTLTTNASPSTPNLFIRGRDVDFSRSTCRTKRHKSWKSSFKEAEKAFSTNKMLVTGAMATSLFKHAHVSICPSVCGWPTLWSKQSN